MFTPPGSNMNFPAPLAVMAFLAAAAGLFLALAASAIACFARKPRFARASLFVVSSGAVIYIGLLLGFSLASHPRILTRSQEKYFCESDCHLAYSILEVKTQPSAGTTHYLVTIRTRFDETTTSPSRPKNAPLTPSPRTICLLDASGHQYLPSATEGTPLLTPLKPADSYTTQLAFNVPPNASIKDLRLLITTTPAWPDRFVIGHENSLFHHKTYFALQPVWILACLEFTIFGGVDAGPQGPALYKLRSPSLLAPAQVGRMRPKPHSVRVFYSGLSVTTP